MTILSNYNKKDFCEGSCSWIMNFLIISIVVIYRKDSIIFLIQTQNCHTRLTYKEKNLWSEQLLIFF